MSSEISNNQLYPYISLYQCSWRTSFFLEYALVVLKQETWVPYNVPLKRLIFVKMDCFAERFEFEKNNSAFLTIRLANMGKLY